MDAHDEKERWRTRLHAARRARPDADREADRARVCGHVLARVAEHGWTCVAAYQPLRTEPGSEQLLAGLVGAGVQVLVPLTLANRDLDWAQWTPAGVGAPLGRGAVAGAAAVLVPASAVARDGTRLGRGGGSYDRALLRAAPDAVRAALIFDAELVPRLPRNEWDQPVTAVVSPSGWLDLGVGRPD